MRKRIISRLGITAALLFAPLVAPIAANAATPAPTPKGCISDRGYLYKIDMSKPHGLILQGHGNPEVVQNTSGRDGTLTLTHTSSGTSQWSVNGSVSGSASYNFAVVSAAVTVTIGGSYASTSSTSQTVTAGMVVPNGRYGILQGGVFRRVSTGHYFFDNGNCTFTTGSTITTKLPVKADGYAATVNTTGIVPWDQG